MQSEIEAKSIKIDKRKIRKQLKELGAERIFKEKKFIRITYSLPESAKVDPKISTWVRVRTDGERTTLTLKMSGDTVDSVYEVDTEVGDFEKIQEFLEKTGFKPKGHEENLRERWFLNGVEFDIDTWPMIDPWLEIEVNPETVIKDFFKKLGLDYSKAYFGSADVVYRKVYHLEILGRPQLTFETKKKK